MKGTEQFKQVIKEYLDSRAADDALFAARYANKNKNKNINECVSYIIGVVKKSGRCGFADDEIYGMAVHYYDEDDIKVESVDGGYDVVVNQSIPLTGEEKKEAHERALQRYEEAELERIKRERNFKKGAESAKKAPKPKEQKPNEAKKEPATESVSGLLKQLELF